MDSSTQYLIVALSLVADIILYAVIARAATGKLGPNSWAGIRTKATRKNDKTWLAAHVAAYPLMRDTALANATLMIVSLFLPFEYRSYLVQVAIGALLAGVIFAGYQGQKAAKAADV
ncbi:putative membrane protein [Aurantimicrobium minutum]|uniref:SdpI family protein n=1 Tax=Aurantimicrobium minutum TaxID=708131 RepID=UPI002474D983|nr:SdpI family protein [Aurantimicrobium minutum]MDH6278145.1 putative membrane protein [Aurantimicrobium minutum]